MLKYDRDLCGVKNKNLADKHLPNLEMYCIGRWNENDQTNVNIMTVSSFCIGHSLRIQDIVRVSRRSCE